MPDSLRSPIDRRVRTLFVLGLFLCCVLYAILLDARSAHAGDASSRPLKTHAPHATVSEVEKIDERLAFEITQIKGNVIYAQGRLTGKQFTGNGSLHLTLVNASHAVAQIYANNSHGTLQGNGQARYHAVGAISYFVGTTATLHGSGKYRKARNLGTKMTGTMNRRALTISISLKGTWDV